MALLEELGLAFPPLLITVDPPAVLAGHLYITEGTDAPGRSVTFRLARSRRAAYNAPTAF